MEMKMNGQMEIVSNCPLCSDRGLHVVGEKEQQTQQCISCGYATNFNFKIKSEESKDENESYSTLTDQMKSWSKVANNHVWIPSFITLPVGMIFPMDQDGSMKWGYADMVDIPEDEREDYPDGKGGFYVKKYDTDNAEVHDEFVVVLHKLNEKIKKGQVDVEKDKSQ
jgi:Zn ribbon nucleic-acid-binding protein